MVDTGDEVAVVRRVEKGRAVVVSGGANGVSSPLHQSAACRDTAGADTRPGGEATILY